MERKPEKEPSKIPIPTTTASETSNPRRASMEDALSHLQLSDENLLTSSDRQPAQRPSAEQVRHETSPQASERPSTSGRESSRPLTLGLSSTKSAKATRVHSLSLPLTCKPPTGTPAPGTPYPKSIKKRLSAIPTPPSVHPLLSSLPQFSPRKQLTSSVSAVDSPRGQSATKTRSLTTGRRASDQSDSSPGTPSGPRSKSSLLPIRDSAKPQTTRPLFKRFIRPESVFGSLPPVGSRTPLTPTASPKGLSQLQSSTKVGLPRSLPPPDRRSSAPARASDKPSSLPGTPSHLPYKQFQRRSSVAENPQDKPRPLKSHTTSVSLLRKSSQSSPSTTPTSAASSGYLSQDPSAQAFQLPPSGRSSSETGPSSPATPSPLSGTQPGHQRLLTGFQTKPRSCFTRSPAIGDRRNLIRDVAMTGSFIRSSSQSSPGTPSMESASSGSDPSQDRFIFPDTLQQKHRPSSEAASLSTGTPSSLSDRLSRQHSLLADYDQPNSQRRCRPSLQRGMAVSIPSQSSTDMSDSPRDRSASIFSRSLSDLWQRTRRAFSETRVANVIESSFRTPSRRRRRRHSFVTDRIQANSPHSSPLAAPVFGLSSQSHPDASFEDPSRDRTTVVASPSPPSQQIRRSSSEVRDSDKPEKLVKEEEEEEEEEEK